MRTLVLALGNPILGDDGVAFHILERLRARLSLGPDIVLDEASTGGFDLLAHFEGFDRVLLLDAMRTLDAEPGEVVVLAEDELKESLNTSCTHTTSFSTAMQVGRTIHPDRMPSEIIILGVEVDCIDEFREDLSPKVASAVPEATRRAVEVLRGWGIGVV